MQRYIALLRGINISGKNKISMSELQEGFTELGYTNVVTHLNSGNVVFTSDSDSCAAISDRVRQMIRERMHLDIPVYVILQAELAERLHDAPDWWGNANTKIYDNLIFLLPPLTYAAFYDAIGSPNAEYEKAYHSDSVVFWSFDRKNYQKTNWWPKTANSIIGPRITIRTANTVRKLVTM